jgi:hypothetical protein
MPFHKHMWWVRLRNDIYWTTFELVIWLKNSGKNIFHEWRTSFPYGWRCLGHNSFTLINYLFHLSLWLLYNNIRFFVFLHDTNLFQHFVCQSSLLGSTTKIFLNLLHLYISILSNSIFLSHQIMREDDNFFLLIYLFWIVW